MKTITLQFAFLILSINLIAGPFAYKRYVHYDFMHEITADDKVVGTYDNNIYNRDLYTQRYNSKSKILYFVKRGCGHHKIMKPFVFVEGVSFDKEVWTDNEYTIEGYFHKTYRNVLEQVPENSNGVEKKWENFPEMGEVFNNMPLGVDIGSSIGYSTVNWGTMVSGIDVEGLMEGEALLLQKAPDMLNKLYDADYDIIYVDFQSGQNFMENNGYALSKLLKIIKDTLDNNGSTEKMVVCGASMGGLVSRFAIRDLELNGGSNYNNCVSKFISFDSPQMGANINMGLQYLLQDIKQLEGDNLLDPTNPTNDERKKVKEIINGFFSSYEKLTCPSASQLMLYSCLSNPIGTGLNGISNTKYADASPTLERLAFNNHPNVLTWPSNCKLISIINGSRLGYQQNSGNYSDCDLMVDVDGVLNVNVKSLPKNNDGYCNTLNVSPANALWLLPSLGPILQNSLNKLEFNVHLRNSLAVDFVSGSYRNDLAALTEINSSWNTAIGTLFGGSILSVLNGYSQSAANFCFIPAMSAAGIKQFTSLVENSSLALPQLFNGSHKLVDPTHQISHFDVVYAPEQNQTHVEITDENINWVMQILNDCDDDIIKFQNEVIPSGTYIACDAIYAGYDVDKYSPETYTTTTYVNTYNENYWNPPATPPGGSVTLYSQTGNYYNSDLVRTWQIITPVDERGQVTIQNGSNVTFIADNLIDLQSGFVVETGAIFDAQISDKPESNCSSSGRYGSGSNLNQPLASSTNIINKRGESDTNYSLPDNSIKNTLVNKELILIPNPANGITNLHYTLEKASDVTIEISNIYGQQISKNASVSQQEPGSHNVEIDISKLSKGIYFVTLKSINGNRSKQLIVN